MCANVSVPTSSMSSAFNADVGIVGSGLTGWNYIVNGFGIVGLTSFVSLIFTELGRSIENLPVKIFFTFLLVLAVGSPITYIYVYIFSLLPYKAQINSINQDHML